MNEKEAREIQNNPEITSDNPMLEGKAYEAKGYLERVEQEARIFGPLVKALETVGKNPHLGVREILNTFYKENLSWKP